MPRAQKVGTARVPVSVETQTRRPTVWKSTNFVRSGSASTDPETQGAPPRVELPVVSGDRAETYGRSVGRSLREKRWGSGCAGESRKARTLTLVTVVTAAA